MDYYLDINIFTKEFAYLEKRKMLFSEFEAVLNSELIDDIKKRMNFCSSNFHFKDVFNYFVFKIP